MVIITKTNLKNIKSFVRFKDYITEYLPKHNNEIDETKLINIIKENYPKVTPAILTR